MNFSRKLSILSEGSSVFHKNISMQNKIKIAFVPLNIYLWIHGIGFNALFNRSKSSLLIIIVSVMIVIICDGSSLRLLQHFAIYIFKNSNDGTRKEITYLIMAAANILLRLLLCFSRQKINILIQKLARVLSNINIKSALMFQNKLIAILIIHDICLLFCIAILIYGKNLQISTRTFYYGPIPPPYSIVLFKLSVAFYGVTYK